MFKNRTEAGKLLAQKLLELEFKKPLVIALPRGGVPVGYEVAKSLNAPLDTIVARKIGAPFNPEFGVGAVAPGHIIIVNEKLLEDSGISRQSIEPIISKEVKEMEIRMVIYESGKHSKNFMPEEVIIVDDGLATGVTARAAIKSVLQGEKASVRIIFTAPICAKDTADELRNLVEVICIKEPEDLITIGSYYDDFPQVGDDEVLRYLSKINSK